MSDSQCLCASAYKIHRWLMKEMAWLGSGLYLHTVDDVWEEHGDVLAYCHGSNDFFDSILPLGLVGIMELRLELQDLSYDSG